MSKINYSAVRNKVKNSPKFETTIDKKVKKNFEQLRSNFIQDFENHPVTQEIDQGPTASNSSGTLNGIGNLFSYIGFQRGSNPVKPVKDFIRNAFKLDKLKSKTAGNKIQMNYKISYFFFFFFKIMSLVNLLFNKKNGEKMGEIRQIIVIKSGNKTKT